MVALTTPHLEVNENGNALNHPGYAQVKCSVCGRLNVCSAPLRQVREECVGAHRKEN